MTVTITSEYVYLGATLVLMLIQILQWRIIGKLKREIENLWQQISILAVSSAGFFDKFQKKIDEKQDRR
jgi:low affinity Fe/Cu permease